MAKKENHQEAVKEVKQHSKLMEYVYMGIAIGIGTLLVWDLTTTNDNTKAINDLIKDVGGMQKDHKSEVDRSSKVDSDQEIESAKNEKKLDMQLELIHKNDRELFGLSRDMHHLHK